MQHNENNRGCKRYETRDPWWIERHTSETSVFIRCPLRSTSSCSTEGICYVLSFAVLYLPDVLPEQASVLKANISV